MINLLKESRRNKELFIKNILKRNHDKTLEEIIAILHQYMEERKAKEWLKNFELRKEITYKEKKGRYYIKVLKV